MKRSTLLMLPVFMPVLDACFNSDLDQGPNFSADLVAEISHLSEQMLNGCDDMLPSVSHPQEVLAPDGTRLKCGRQHGSNAAPQITYGEFHSRLRDSHTGHEISQQCYVTGSMHQNGFRIDEQDAISTGYIGPEKLTHIRIYGLDGPLDDGLGTLGFFQGDMSDIPRSELNGKQGLVLMSYCSNTVQTAFSPQALQGKICASVLIADPTDEADLHLFSDWEHQVSVKLTQEEAQVALDLARQHVDRTQMMMALKNSSSSPDCH